MEMLVRGPGQYPPGEGVSVSLTDRHGPYIIHVLSPYWASCLMCVSHPQMLSSLRQWELTDPQRSYHIQKPHELYCPNPTWHPSYKVKQGTGNLNRVMYENTSISQEPQVYLQ